ncbi:MAG: hypothetical protein ACUVRD_04855 [Bacteroidia bacterium]
MQTFEAFLPGFILAGWGMVGLFISERLFVGVLRGIISFWLLLGVYRGYTQGISGSVGAESWICGIAFLFSLFQPFWIVPVRVLWTFQVLAAQWMVRVSHPLTLWVFLEMFSIFGYLLVGVVGQGERRWTHTLRYYLWGTVASLFIVGGIVYGYVERQTWSWAEWPLVVRLTIGIGLIIKMALLPGHLWWIGLKEILSPTWLGWFSTIPKFLPAYVGIRFLGLSGQEEVFWIGVFVLSHLAYFLAIGHQDPLTILMYGSIAQVGIAGLGWWGGENVFISFWGIYMVTSFLAFAFWEGRPSGENNAWVWLFIAANLVGLPPVMGFWVKSLLFWSVLKSSSYALIALVGAIIATFMSLWAYGKVWLYLRAGRSGPLPNTLLIASVAFLVVGGMVLGWG